MAVNPTRLSGMTEITPPFSFRPIGFLRGAATRKQGAPPQAAPRDLEGFGRMEP